MAYHSLIAMLSAPVPPNAPPEDTLWARVDRMARKIKRRPYHTRRRRRKALRRYHRAHHAAGRVMFARMGEEGRRGQ